MLAKDVRLIEYSYKVDMGNCITHAVGAVAAVIGMVFMLLKADGAGEVISAAVYGVSLIAVYAASAVYHGLPAGESKRRARLVDHSAIPVLIAGTATPCAMVTLWNLNPVHGVFVLATAWVCALFGLFSKLFFFEKLKKVTVTVYIVSSLAMLLSAIPSLGEISKEAFGGLLVGCLVYLAGSLFCAIGMKKESMHVVFHIFTAAASAIHWFVIYNYVV